MSSAEPIKVLVISHKFDSVFGNGSKNRVKFDSQTTRPIESSVQIPLANLIPIVGNSPCFSAFN